MARGDPPMTLEALVPYFSPYNVTVALKGRLAKLGPEGRPALQEVSRYQQMLSGFREAIQKAIELKQQR